MVARHLDNVDAVAHDNDTSKEETPVTLVPTTELFNISLVVPLPQPSSPPLPPLCSCLATHRHILIVAPTTTLHQRHFCRHSGPAWRTVVTPTHRPCLQPYPVSRRRHACLMFYPSPRPFQALLLHTNTSPTHPHRRPARQPPPTLRHLRHAAGRPPLHLNVQPPPVANSMPPAALPQTPFPSLTDPATAVSFISVS